MPAVKSHETERLFALTQHVESSKGDLSHVSLTLRTIGRDLRFLFARRFASVVSGL